MSFTALASCSEEATLSPMNWMNLASRRLSFSEIALLMKTSCRLQGSFTREGVGWSTRKAEMLFCG